MTDLALASAERVYAPDGKSYTLRSTQDAAGVFSMRVTSGKGANMIDLVPAVVGIDPAVVRAEVLTRLRALAPVDAAPSPSPDPLDRARQLAADIARHDEIAAELVTLRARILAAMGGVA